MNKVIEDGLKHFRSKAARYRKLAEKAEAEIARLEALLQERQPTPHALDGAGTSPEYGATSNCVDCGKRIVFCGDGVWLHCEPQNHGHARPNGAIVNPPRQ